MSIESIEARVGKATEGPWELMGDSEIVTYTVPPTASHPFWTIGVSPHLIVETADADFMAHARQDIPALLKVAKAARNLLEYTVGLMEIETDKDYYAFDSTDPIVEAVVEMDRALAELEAME